MGERGAARARGRRGRRAAALWLVLAGALAAGALAGCAGGNQAPRRAAPAPKSVKTATTLTGAGATFPQPLYSRWFAEYAKEKKADVRFNYQPIGSGGGIRQITARTVDFGASDAPMSDEELKKAPGPILHIPTALGAVVVAYNLPDRKGDKSDKADLRLSPAVLADIFLGKIKRWDDTRLKELNPDLNLPGRDITVVHRSDGSGTTLIFTDYLSQVSDAWKGGPGKGKSVEWPVGLGAKGNDGVTAQIKQAPGSIGYLELAYATQNRLAHASLRNRAGKFVRASADSVTVTAAGVAEKIPDDLRVSVVNAPGDGAYPISAFTYLLIYKEQADAAKGKALAQFLHWALTDGQKFAKPLDYAPLPGEVAKKAGDKVDTMTSKGKPLAR